MIIESYRYRASADFAWAMKLDYHCDQPWVMLHQELAGGEEYIVADPEGARSVAGTHKVIQRWNPRESEMRATADAQYRYDQGEDIDDGLTDDQR